jgi:hypothetical protein
MTCRFVSSTEPRVVAGRHAVPCVCDNRELGCLPCPEPHCIVCGRNHAKAACTGCLDAARSDLEAIWDLCSSLPAEAAEKGVQSEALMLLGPSADPEAWRNRATSAMVGRIDASYLEDCRDELHPLWVLGSWEQIWRDHLDHFSEAPITVVSAHSYLNMQIGYMSEQAEPAFDEFAREIGGCRAHLENVIREGLRDEAGVPCSDCNRTLTRRSAPATGCFHSRKAMLMARVDDHTAPDAVLMLRRILLAYPEMAEEHARCNQGGLVEHYECRGCRRVYTEAEYWLAVRARVEEVS